MKATIVSALTVCLAASALGAQTATPAPSLFTRSDAILSGAFLVGSIALSTADVRIARWWTNPSNHDKTKDSYARRFAKIQEGTLTVGNLALWGIARLAKAPAMADITFHAAEAVVVGSLASQVIRGPLGRSRPHVTDYSDQYDFRPFRGFREFNYRAFPSIHTASAFAVATVYTLETSRRAPGATWIVGPVAYAIAAGPGIARMYNGLHWSSDVLMGAFVGTMAGAKVMRYNHVVKPGNRVNKFFLGARNTQVGIGTFTYGFTF